MNKLRQRIWGKSGGLCWYCGTALPEKGWHMDHFLPIVRHLITGVPEYPERDCEENLVPSCASCNRAKSSMPLESWRKIIKGHVVSLNRDSTQYKIAKRYGLVSEMNIEVKFWFEKQAEKQQKFEVGKEYLVDYDHDRWGFKEGDVFLVGERYGTHFKITFDHGEEDEVTEEVLNGLRMTEVQSFQ